MRLGKETSQGSVEIVSRQQVNRSGLERAERAVTGVRINESQVKAMLFHPAMMGNLFLLSLDHYWEYHPHHMHSEFETFGDNHFTELQSVQPPQLQQLYRHMEIEQMHVLDSAIPTTHIGLNHQVWLPALLRTSENN